MARHKKKSSPPPKPDESKVDDTIPPTESEETPQTEANDTPPSEPVISQESKDRATKKLDQLFWLRIGLAVIAGTAATFIFEPIDDAEERRWSSIAFMIIIFMISIGIAKGMKMQLPSSDRKKIVTQAIGSYVFIYLFIWILSYTLVNISETNVGLPGLP